MSIAWSASSPAVDLWRSLNLAENGQAPLGRLSSERIDAAYAGLDGTSADARLAWKVLRDPAYQDVYRRFGSQKAVQDAGFILDGLDVPADKQPWWAPGLVTPYAKLLPALADLPAGARGTVLMTTGAMAPVHLGHLSMMEAARAHLQARGETVLGGYLSPSHDDYVSTKQGGQAHMPIGHRLAMCQEAVAESDWLMVDPWEGRYAATDLNFTDVLRRLGEYLGRLFPDKRIQVAYVFGGDNLGFLAASRWCDSGGAPRNSPMLCVERTPPDEEQKRRMARLAAAGVPVAMVAPLSKEMSTISSTRVRAGDLSALAQRSRPRYSDVRENVAGDAASPAQTRYLVRADLAWATRRWRLPAGACDEFTRGLCALLEKAFSETTAPDRPRPMKTQLLSHAVQRRRVAALGRVHQVLSLDAGCPAEANLRISRLFGLADGQVFSNVLVARPGAPTLAEQFAVIGPGPVVLVEDDVASGTTLARVREMLDGKTEIESVELLTGWALTAAGELDSRSFYDVVDARDFLLGAEEGGLVVELPDRSTARAPYLLPWVNNVTRAKLPCSSEVSFSKEVWALNSFWLLKHAPHRTLGDSPKPVQVLFLAEGYALETPLHELAISKFASLQSMA